jgi:hypothetical protein
MRPPTEAELIVLAHPLPNLIVEIDFVDGYPPGDSAIEELKRNLQEQTAKEKITFLAPRAIAPQGGNYTDEDLHAIQWAALDSRGVGVSQGASVLHVLYLDGRMRERNHVGLSLGNGAIVLFPIYFDIQAVGPAAVYNSGLDRGRAEIERAVLIHELGHAFGLVGCGAPMVRPHNDPSHPCHSANEGSVMWWAVDGPRERGLAEQLQGEMPYQFDEDDLADLAAFRKANG